MDINELRALSMADLKTLYNSLAEKQVKRFESRQKAEERTQQLLRENGKWVDEKVTGLTPKAARNVRETAEAGINDGTPLRKGARGPGAQASARGAETKKAEAAARAATKAEKGASERVQEAAKGKQGGKGTAEGKKPAPAAAPEAKRGRGAPVKNDAYEAIGEKEKGYNPKGLKIQASSARGVVIAALRKERNGLSRSELEKMFPEQNVKSALDVLVKLGFIRVLK